MVKETSIMETTAVYSEDMTKRYELTRQYKGEQGKKILVIMMNPPAQNIKQIDTTSQLLLNHLSSVDEGYSYITVWNLFADITNKLKPSTVTDNTDNLKYLEKLLKKESWLRLTLEKKYKEYIRSMLADVVARNGC
jgi:hypothetical protein